MKKKVLIILIFLLCFVSFALAEVKYQGPGPAAEKFPKLPKTPNDPILRDGGVYPMWGPVCQRYTYFTYYQDREGRTPEYVRLWFNGQWIDVQPAFDVSKATKEDFQKGVRYEYKFVPNKLDANFFFFEASNGLGKTREGIIDSPGNGPVLFEGDFLDNEIALIDSAIGQKIWRYPTGKEWIGGVALSDDGRYLAAKTSYKILFFETSSAEPIWIYEYFKGASPIILGGDVKGGVDISGDGSKIIASIGDAVLLFDKSSNKPVWQYNAGNAYNVAISRNGQYLAAATAGTETDLNSNLIILWQAKSNKPLWQYHASGNFHDVSLSDDGSFLAGATGCPDRRAYIFSRDSNQPFVRSEMLTYDSPVSRSKITADGKLAIFNTDGGPNSVLIALFSKDSDQPIWTFAESGRRASRALAITPDGQYIAVADMEGDVYLFSKDSNQPFSHWRIQASTGVLDLSDDGAFIAVGGTDNKVHLLDAVSKNDIAVNFDEFVEEIDIAANNKYVAAGTGGSIYFFESISGVGKVFSCQTIIEPPPFEEAMMSGFEGVGGPEGESTTNGSAMSRKTIIEFFLHQGKYLLVILAFLLVGVIIAFIKWRRWWFWLIFVMIVLGMVIGVWFWLRQPSQEGTFREREGETVCGDDRCEPDFGESRENCPQDCSGGD